MPIFNVRTRRSWPLLAALLVLCGVFYVGSRASAEDPLRMGVNRVNLAWLSRDDQEKILKQIAASGVTDIRLSLSRPIDKSIDALEIADRLGLRILLEIQLNNKSYYPPGTRPRTGHDRSWEVYRLSDLDPDLYRRELRKALQRIDQLGIRLAAVEPGNEINFSPYNGDLIVYPEPGVRTPRSRNELQNRDAFERGLDAYVAAVKITGDEVGATIHSRDAAIVSAGLTDMSARFADKQGLERLDAAEMIELLRERGLDSLVDAYGIHLYPGNRPVRALQARVKDVLDFCQPGDAGKPCWITEWGIANMDMSCPVDDRQRKRKIRAMREIFEELTEADRLSAAFYYDWDTKARYSVWRCGGLAPAGALAIGVERE